jgi:peptide/nickel transport system permease protein
MSRGRYILRRLVQMVPVLLGITIIIFAMLRLLPGDPATTMLGPRASQEAVARLNHRMGLDKPIVVQYVYYMRDLVQLDLGDSLRYKVPVSSLIARRLQVTLSLVLMTALLTALISLPLGILAALRKDSLLDNVVRSTLMVTMVMPAFWIGIMFLILFAVKIRLFPVAGYGDGFVDHIYHLFLPALTISLGLAPILIRSLRSSILETLRSDYTRTARAKGLNERAVIVTHVLRNALIAPLTLLGISIGFLMGGAVITERVFALPGAGALLIDSVTGRDYPVAQAATLIFAAIIILVNLATDVAYSFLDPRVRFD